MAARREVVRQLQRLGLSERQALRLIGISASTLRYGARDDGNLDLRARLKEFAGQHRRHGYRMLHNRLRHEGWAIQCYETWGQRSQAMQATKQARGRCQRPLAFNWESVAE